MKKIYSTSLLISLLFFSGCSKDILKSYDERIIGDWQITEVNRVGFGGNTDNLPFKEGTFTFKRDGSLTYTNSNGAVYKGSWEIVKKRYDEEDVRRSLQITAVDFTNQNFLSEYYDDMNFTGTNHFKANIIQNFHTYVTHFRR
jgi:hypothetical protein